MTAPRPLGLILTRRLALIAVAVVLINGIAVAAYYGTDRQALEAEVIAHRMEALQSALQGAPPQVDPDARALYAAHPDAYGFALLDRDGTILDAENPGLIPAPATETGIFAQDWITRLAAPEGALLVASHKVNGHDQGLRLVFVMRQDPANLLLGALLAEMIRHIWIPMLPVVLLLIGANAFMIRRGLVPVTAAARWARSVRPGAPTPPAPHDRVPAEIADLVDATQRSLDRLNVALAAEQRRAAEAAHALRTPVAVLIARLDALPPGETTDRLRADMAALARTVRQVLAASRADALGVDDTARTDLARIAESVIAALAPFAHARGVDLSLMDQPLPALALAEPEGVEVALSNLVENAILHAGPGRIEVTAGPGPVLRVRDHGPGLPPGGMARLFEPFWRGEAAAPGGAGLGLAIVDRLQRAQGGTVEARAPAGGGAEFTLTFRPATI